MSEGKLDTALSVPRAAQQAELARLGLQEKHRQMADKLFDMGLEPLPAHDDIAAYVSKSKADGQGGALQLQAVPSTDGKTVTYNKVNPDGSLTPTTHVYTNDSAGADQAKLWLAQNVPLQSKITAAHQTFEEKLAAKNEPRSPS